MGHLKIGQFKVDHFEEWVISKGAHCQNQSPRKWPTEKNETISELVTSKIGHFEINHLEEMVTFENWALRKISHFEIDHF